VTVKSDGGIVFHCFRCEWSGTERPSRPASISPIRPKPERRRGLASTEQARWDGAKNIAGTLADKYLQARRCYFPPLDGALRFLPAALHWPTKTTHPAMLALVTDARTNEPLSLHFTFLKADGSGKAEVDTPKLLLAGHAIDGGVIRLWPDGCVTTGLGIAEGIETALAAAHYFRPAWAAIDAGHLAKFPVLDGIEALTIIMDRDAAGHGAAQACRNRWLAANREVRVVGPRIGNDFADMMGAR
jgi:hypothetical protein